MSKKFTNLFSNVQNYKFFLHQINYVSLFYLTSLTHNFDKYLTDISEIRFAILGLVFDFKESNKISSVAPQLRSTLLTRYGEDLTERISQIGSEPLIGREKEVNEVIQILSRRRKNNPVLVGEPGVGKTAIVEGVANFLITNGSIPESLRNIRFVTLEVGRLIAGAQYRGQLEERLTGIIAEVRMLRHVVLVIDEIHAVVGVGGGDGALNVGNLLKPPLSRGEVRCIGTTTSDSYKEKIESDTALARRFKKVVVEESSVVEVVEILWNLREGYETYHGLVISDEALLAAVEFAAQYIPDRFLPDKALDLVDDACSRVRYGSLDFNFDQEESEVEQDQQRQHSEVVESKQFVPSDEVISHLESLLIPGPWNTIKRRRLTEDKDRERVRQRKEHILNSYVDPLLVCDATFIGEEVEEAYQSFFAHIKAQINLRKSDLQVSYQYEEMTAENCERTRVSSEYADIMEEYLDVFMEYLSVIPDYLSLTSHHQEKCIRAADPRFLILSLLMDLDFGITSNIFLIQHISGKLFDSLFPGLIEKDSNNDYSDIESNIDKIRHQLSYFALGDTPISIWFKENGSSFKDQLIKITKSKLKKTLKFKDLALENQCFQLEPGLEKRESLIQKDLSYLMQGKEENVSRKKIVNEEDIIEVLGLVVDVPVAKVTEDESVKLLNIEETLHRRVIGQHEAVSVIARSLRRSRVGLRNGNRPIASFLFAGPTGVGKTEIVKTLAKSYFGSSDSLIVFDMSEYMERHSVSRLVGASPGYVGYEEGGLLTEAVRKKPYSIVLFDEIEKAHQDVFNLMLQIFEEGQLTDSKGRKTDFGNTLLILTSNVGSDRVAQASESFELKQGKRSIGLSSPYDRVKRVVSDEIKKKFRPEFLNRLDEIVVFRRLTKDEVGEIAEIMLRDVFEQVYLQGIKLAVTNRFKAHLIDQGYDPVYGARPLRRVITTLVLDNLAQEMLLENIKSGETAILDIGMDNEVKVCKGNSFY